MTSNRARFVSLASTLLLAAACSGGPTGSQLAADSQSGTGDETGWVRYQNLPIDGCSRRVLAGAARLPNVVYVTPLAMVGLDSHFAQDVHLRAPTNDGPGALSFTVYFPDLDLGEKVARGELTPPEDVRALLEPGCSPDKIKDSLNRLRAQSPAVARLLPEPVTHVEPLPVSAVGVALSGGLKSDPIYFGTPGTTGDLTYSGKSFPVVIPVTTAARYHDLADQLTYSDAGLPVEVSFNFSARTNGEWVSVSVKRSQLLQSIQSLIGLGTDTGAGAGFTVKGVKINASTSYVTNEQAGALFKQALLNIGVDVRTEDGNLKDQRYDKLVQSILDKLIDEDQSIVAGPTEDHGDGHDIHDGDHGDHHDDHDDQIDHGDKPPTHPIHPIHPIHPVHPTHPGQDDDQVDHRMDSQTFGLVPYDAPAPTAPSDDAGSGPISADVHSKLNFKFQLMLQRLSSGSDFSLTIDNTEAARGASVSVPTMLQVRRSESQGQQLTFQSSTDAEGRKAPWETIVADLRRPTTLRIWPQQVQHDVLSLSTTRRYLSKAELSANLPTYSEIFPFLGRYNYDLADWSYNGQTLGWIWDSWFRVPLIGDRKFHVWGQETTESHWETQQVQQVAASASAFADIPLEIGFGAGGATVRLADLLQNDANGRWTGSFDAVSGALVVTFEPAKVAMVQIRNAQTFGTTTYTSKRYFEQIFQSGQPYQDEDFVGSRFDETRTETAERTTWQMNFVTVSSQVVFDLNKNKTKTNDHQGFIASSR